MEKYTSLFAKYISSSLFEQLPNDVVQQAKKRILDTIGVAVGGYYLSGFPQMTVDYYSILGGKPEATAIQSSQKMPAVNAAMVNAVCAHALDMDDGHRYAAHHPGTVVIPAALASAELVEANTRDLITGIVVGYEVMIRLGMAVNPSSLERGFHTTGTCGAFGAAAATAKIMDLSYEETLGSLGMAGLQSAGLLQTNHDVQGSLVKPLNPGKAAASGLLSSVFASEGFKGPSEIIEGVAGFLKATADDVNYELLNRELGRSYEIKNVYDKLHAACRHTHAPIDAVFLLKSKVSPERIKEIECATYNNAIKLAGIMNPTSPSGARFSIPFSIGLAFFNNDAGADKFAEKYINDCQIQELASKVKLTVSNKWENLYPDKRGATVTIKEIDGNRISTEVDLAKGEPENPAECDDLYKKFYTNVNLVKTGQEVEQLSDVIMNLENHSLEEFTSLLR